jgi:hypothetical protein
MTKGILLLVAILGTLIGYFITDLFIIEIPFWKFFLIELTITFMHELYNQAKQHVTINP